MPDQVSLQFLGASRTVTGSKYLIKHKDKKVLVDCGLFQGRKELRNRNWQSFPIPTNEIDAVVLTHAHLDHTGYLPRIVKQGFSGPIYCTEPTAELTKYILLDSAHLQEEEAKHANKHKTSKHNPAKPLYTTEDAESALELLKIIPRDRFTKILDGFEVLRQIKNTDILKRIPVIVLTSSKEEGDRTLSYDIGANSYLMKPVAFTGFIDVIKRIDDYWFSLNIGAPDA